MNERDTKSDSVSKSLVIGPSGVRFNPNPKAMPDYLPDHDGDTYEPEFDKSRLNRQQLDVYEQMKDGRWWTLRELSDATGHPEASVSARIRDFRKDKFGCFSVDSARQNTVRKGRAVGLWSYRLHVGPEQMSLGGRNDE